MNAKLSPSAVREARVNIDRAAVGKRMRELRTASRWSRYTVCESIQAPGRGMLADWENGRSLPRADYLLAIADLYGVSCEFILRGTDPPAAPVILTVRGRPGGIRIIQEFTK
jgi:transcriptional regulator with XRE-family HTH domain